MCKQLLKRSNNLYAAILLAVVITMLGGCAALRPGGNSSPVQGVTGTVWLQPDYDASDMSFFNNPPDLSPRPIPNATVYLLNYPKDTLTNNDILAVTQSDTAGQFTLRADHGTYYLAVRTANISTTLITGTRDVTVRLDPPVMDLVIIEIRANEFTEQSFKIYEMVPQ